MHPIPVRLTPHQQAWLDAQTRSGLFTRSAAIRLCIQQAMDSNMPLLAQAPNPDPRQLPS
mgnify:CR=1 FL=1